ncbi:MAG: methionyl-tRNA formyltransferase [Bacteroidetes bacterium]|nr:methionyl-tRNA formyltransferase [Bacteroidota bacterium]
MGTPEFAVASLDALIKNGFNVVAVVTAPDKPSGRGMKLNVSAVKKYAIDHGLPLLQPEKLRNPGFLSALQSLNADLQIVVAFRMLPEAVWDMPPMGTINVHGSMLPQYRGAAPINWAIINGEKETGVTTFKLQHAIDTGDILLQERITIADDETAGQLHERMKDIGAALLVKTVNGLLDKTLNEKAQSAILLTEEESALRHAPKIFTDTSRIDWGQPVDRIYNLIRGLSPYPAAFTMLDGKTIKIFNCKKTHQYSTQSAGSHTTDGKTFLRFFASDGYIDITDLQAEGKKRMAIADFLRGYRL